MSTNVLDAKSQFIGVTALFLKCIYAIFLPQLAVTLQNMAKRHFKYKLKERYNDLPKSISLASFLAQIKKHGITERTFYRDQNLLVGEVASIPSDRLDAYAVVFGCSPDQLKNYEVKGKSILEMLNSKKSKTGLV